MQRGRKKRPEGRRRRHHPPPPGAREEFRCSLDLRTAWKRTLTPLTGSSGAANELYLERPAGRADGEVWIGKPVFGISRLTFGLGTKERERRKRGARRNGTEASV